MKRSKIRSMTGYGHCRFTSGRFRGQVEVRSINHRYLDYSTRLSLPLASLEQRIKELVSQYVVRGKVTLSISLSGQNGNELVEMDFEKLEFYQKQLKRAGKKFGFSSELSVSDVIRLPNIFTVQPREEEPETLWRVIQDPIKKALEKLVLMREKEGFSVAEDMLKRLDHLQKCAKRIESLSKGLVPTFKEKLEKRISELLSSPRFDQERIEQEVALFAQHHDITEELVRFDSHLAQFKQIMASEQEIGKKLDFLMQEINRESNTIASKSLSSEITQCVVEMKTEQEKIREQIQNIE